jgi:hypothetical protein
MSLAQTATFTLGSCPTQPLGKPSGKPLGKQWTLENKNQKKMGFYEPIFLANETIMYAHALFSSTAINRRLYPIQQILAESEQIILRPKRDPCPLPDFRRHPRRRDLDDDACDAPLRQRQHHLIRH